MISKIQTQMKAIISLGTGLSENIIYTEEQDVNVYHTRPWISIMPQMATIEEAWHKDNFYQNDSDNAVVVTRKYNVLQAMLIHLEFMEKDELTNGVQQILLSLPKQLIIDRGVVNIIPKSIDYVLTSGVLDPNKANISLQVAYAIREEKELAERIKAVDFDTHVL